MPSSHSTRSRSGSLRRPALSGLAMVQSERLMNLLKGREPHSCSYGTMSRNMRHHLIVGSIDSILVIKRHWQADDSRRRQLWVKSRSADHVAGRVHARLVAPNQRTSGPQADWCKNQEIRDKKRADQKDLYCRDRLTGCYSDPNQQAGYGI